jgi:hypothetical protein
VVADGGQTLQYGLPLFPVQLTEERPQTLNEGVLEQRLAIGFGDEEAIQTDTERLGDFFERSEARRHLSAFDARQIGAGDARASLKLTLRHAARFAKLANALTDVFNGLAVRPLLEKLSVVARQLLRYRRRDKELHLGRQHVQTTPADIILSAVLNQPASLATNNITIELIRALVAVVFRHRYSSQILLACGRGNYPLGGKGRNRRKGIVAGTPYCVKRFLKNFEDFNRGAQRECLKNHKNPLKKPKTAVIY